MIPNSVIQGLMEKLLPGITVLKHSQEGRAPSLPYFTWQEISNPANGRETVSYVYDSDAGTYLEHVDINKTETIQVDFYSHTDQRALDLNITTKSAYAMAEEMIARINTYSSQAYQKTNNIAIMNWQDLTPNTRFLGDINELRATIELYINNNYNYQESAYSVDVDSVDVNLTTEGI